MSSLEHKRTGGPGSATITSGSVGSAPSSRVSSIQSEGKLQQAAPRSVGKSLLTGPDINSNNVKCLFRKCMKSYNCATTCASYLSKLCACPQTFSEKTVVTSSMRSHTHMHMTYYKNMATRTTHQGNGLGLSSGHETQQKTAKRLRCSGAWSRTQQNVSEIQNRHIKPLSPYVSRLLV